jgi:hypothetical protein
MDCDYEELRHQICGTSLLDYSADHPFCDDDPRLAVFDHICHNYDSQFSVDYIVECLPKNPYIYRLIIESYETQGSSLEQLLSHPNMSQVTCLSLQTNQCGLITKL